jgi:hypothetical protein
LEWLPLLIENDDDRDERDHDCEREQNGLHVIAKPSEKHGPLLIVRSRAARPQLRTSNMKRDLSARIVAELEPGASWAR